MTTVNNKNFIIYFVLVICLLGPEVSLGIVLPGTSSDASQKETDDKALQESPRTFVKRLLGQLSQSPVGDISAYFDKRYDKAYTANTRNSVRDVFARLLDEYGVMQPSTLVSNLAEGNLEDNVDLAIEKVGDFKIGGETIPFLLVRLKERDGNFKWYISRETSLLLLTKIPDTKASLINQFLPPTFLDNTWRGAPVGQWLSIPLIAVFAYLITWLTTRLAKLILNHFLSIKTRERALTVLKVVLLPANLIIAVFFFLAVTRYLGVSIVIRQSMSFFTISIFWFAIFILLWSLIDIITIRSEDYLRQKNRAGGLSILMFFRASLKFILVFLSLIILLDSSGVDVTTGLAALGIGGIALALGAQKTIENLVGGVTLIVDQPLRVGDFCKIGDLLGEVENIGIRSTRLRTRADTVVTIPNGVLSVEKIENYTKRRKYLIHQVLNLR